MLQFLLKNLLRKQIVSQRRYDWMMRNTELEVTRFLTHMLKKVNDGKQSLSICQGIENIKIKKIL
jgi:hypothetical protein